MANSKSPCKTSCWKFPFKSLRSGSSAPGSEPSEDGAIRERARIDTLNSKLNILEQQLEECNKEISSLKDKNDALVRNNLRMNEDKALNVKSLEQQLETCNKEISSLKDKNDVKWKKREKDIASIMIGNVELRPKTSDELLVLYYTKRADTRMSSKKFRKAMDDCKMATDLDPGCLKALLINGSCHLALGEIDEALSCYYKCLNSNMAQFDRTFIRKASDGLKDAKIVANNIKQSAELLQMKTFESATRAKEFVTKALLVSCYSEKLLKMKGEALFQLHEYEEVVQMCEQTLGMAKMNRDNVNSKCLSDEDLWRWSLMSRSYYRMGKFDMSVLTFQKYEHVALSETKTKELSLFSAVIVRELLQIKSDGNDAFQSDNYIEAVKHYTNAIMHSTESRPFAAICLCNRAVAHLSFGNVIDAIKDCNLAIALDGDNMKAISMRAGLHEKIRDYEHASLDLERLISLQEKRSEKKYMKELKDSRERLSSLKKNMGKGMSMDLYMILGLGWSESDSSKIKKAYDKAARSPDEAGKFLAISESGTDGHIWKEIKKIIRTDAEKLLKKIGEAYSVLSDSNKAASFKHELTLLSGYIVPLVPYRII